MRKLVSILFAVGVAIMVFEGAILAFIVPEEPAWEEFTGKGFSCQVPVSHRETFESEGWTKNRFRSAAGDLYVSVRKRERSPEEALAYFSQYVKPSYDTDADVFETGRFFIEHLGKGRRYIYIFSAGEKVFWIENSAYGSTLRFFKDVVDRVLESLVVEGKRMNPGFRSRSAEINREIVWHSQGVAILAGFMLGLPLFIILVVAVPILALVGRLPRFSGGHPVRSEENLFAWARHPLGFQGTLVAVALFEDRLTVFSWKRPFIVVTREEGSVSRVPGRDKIVVARDKRRATIDVKHPGRWLDDISARGFRVTTD